MTDAIAPSVAPAAPARSMPTVAIALGAGGARGLAHIPVIEALDELGVRPVAIAGSSMGAIIGAGAASGMTGRDIRDYTLETIGRRGNVANRLWSLGPKTMRDALGGLRIGQFNLERILEAFLPPDIPADFAQLTIPLQVVATDYYGQCELVAREGDLRQALAASAAIPALFMPVHLNGRVLVDGGIVNPVPYEHLRPFADIVIGVDVVGGPCGDEMAVPSRIDVLFGTTQLLMQTAIGLKLRLDRPDIFLRPPVNAFRVLDFLKAQQVLEASAGVKDQLKRELEARFETFERTQG